MKIYVEQNLIEDTQAIYINFGKSKGFFSVELPEGDIIAIQDTDKMEVTNSDIIQYKKDKVGRNYVFGFTNKLVEYVYINGERHALKDYVSTKKLNVKTRENILYAYIASQIHTTNFNFIGKILKGLVKINSDLIKDQYLHDLLIALRTDADFNNALIYTHKAATKNSSRYPSGLLIETKKTLVPKMSMFQILSCLLDQPHSFIIPVNAELYKGIDKELVKQIPVFRPLDNKKETSLLSAVMGDSSANLSLRFFVDGQVMIDAASAVMNNMSPLVDCDIIVTRNIITNGKYNPDTKELLINISTILYKKFSNNNPEGFELLEDNGDNVVVKMILEEIPLYGDISLIDCQLLDFIIGKRINEVRLNILRNFIEKYAKYQYRKLIDNSGKTLKPRYSEQTQRRVLINNHINPQFMTYNGFEKIQNKDFNIERIQLRGDKMRLPSLTELATSKFKKGVCPHLREGSLGYWDKYTKKVETLGKNTEELSKYLYKEYSDAFKMTVRNDLFLLGIKTELLNNATSSLWDLFTNVGDRYVCEVDNHIISLKMQEHLVNV